MSVLGFLELGTSTMHVVCALYVIQNRFRRSTRHTRQNHIQPKKAFGQVCLTRQLIWIFTYVIALQDSGKGLRRRNALRTSFMSIAASQ